MLSKKAQYALQALAFLSDKKDAGPVLISTISTERNISLKFLEHILLELKKGGVLGSKKGKGGGYYLIKDAKSVTVAQVLRIIDGPVAMLPCVSLNYFVACENCDQKTCGINHVFAEVRDATLNVLQSKTVADLGSLAKTS
jgi:Rrf2 family protein